VLALAKQIPFKKNLTVITASLQVALELIDHPDMEVIQLGGILRKTSSSVTGPYAQKILTDFFCSKLFLGVDGIDLEFGLTTTSAMEAHLNRQMIDVSQKVIVLSDSTKFGKRGFGRICGLEEVDQVITDAGVSDHFVNQLESRGIEVTIV
jgi:DeoR family transcriptional regulator of aga operon